MEGAARHSLNESWECDYGEEGAVLAAERQVGRQAKEDKESKVTVEFEIPGLAIRNGLNLREHWGVRAKRSHEERRAVKLGMVAAGAWPAIREMGATKGPFHVQLTRVSQRKLDDDNCVGGFKSVRDELADLLEMDDGDPRIHFTYFQEIGPLGVRIRVNCG